MQNRPFALTPEQVAVVNSTAGDVYAQDPTSKRRYRLIEQPIREDQLTDDELREMIQAGIDQLDRGECKEWNVDEFKERLLTRLVKEKSLEVE